MLLKLNDLVFSNLILKVYKIKYYRQKIVHEWCNLYNIIDSVRDENYIGYSGYVVYFSCLYM